MSATRGTTWSSPSKSAPTFRCRYHALEYGDRHALADARALVDPFVVSAQKGDPLDELRDKVWDLGRNTIPIEPGLFGE